MKIETYNQSIGIMNDHWLLLSSIRRPSRLNVSIIIVVIRVGNLNHYSIRSFRAPVCLWTLLRVSIDEGTDDMGSYPDPLHRNR